MKSARLGGRGRVTNVVWAHVYPSPLFVYILLEEIDDKITLPNIDSSVEVLQQVYDTRARIDNKWMVVNGPWLFYRGLCYLELASKLVANFLREIITIVRSDCFLDRGYFILFDNFDIMWSDGE